VKRKSVLFLVLALFGTAVHAQEALHDNTKSAKADHVTQEQTVRLGKLLDQFYADCGRYPSTDEGLRALVTKPKNLDCPKWGIESSKGVVPYLSSLPENSHWNYRSKNGQTYELN
jgi:hypothetical protein